ncbi:MAG: substrate-binding domain-containing protein [Lachnospiraceae bacterium]|nr:substrate-binding domain-containing protein [Lachnospiraceae bacterium]
MEESRKEKSRKRPRIGSVKLLILTSAFAIVVLLAGVFFYWFYSAERRKVSEDRVYDRYYAMIAEDHKSAFWQSVYSGAQDAAKDKNAYVELMGAELSRDYTPEELMEIAISSHVDGIMIYGNDSEEMTALIDRAFENGIPVVTMYSDSPNSQRCSFVGISGYNMGLEYGRQIVSILNEKKDDTGAPFRITMLVDYKMPAYDQNVILSGLKDTLTGRVAESEYEIATVPVDNGNPFSVEESIRDVFMQEEIPDMLICLGELDTTSAYQAVIDYNQVGSVYILGYYDSEKILNAINRNVVYSTIAVDTAELGRYCVEALEEYRETGNTSQYFTADITLIDRNNVAEYMKKEEETDED